MLLGQWEIRCINRLLILFFRLSPLGIQCVVGKRVFGSDWDSNSVSATFFLLERPWASSLPSPVIWWALVRVRGGNVCTGLRGCWNIMLSPLSSQFRAKRRKRQEGRSWAADGIGGHWVLHVEFTTRWGGHYQNGLQERVCPSLLISFWLLK